MTREKIYLGQHDVLDPAAGRFRVGDVPVDVALGVDDHCDARLFVGDEVRGVSEAAEVVLLQKHGDIFCLANFS